MIEQKNMMQQHLMQSLIGATLILKRIKETRCQIINIGGMVDESNCHDDLSTADENQDGWLNKTEFVHFVHLQGETEITNSTSFENLPKHIKLIYEKSSRCTNCLLEIGCCSKDEEMIEISGASPYMKASVEQLIHLHSLCADTYAGVEESLLLASLQPTQNPTFRETFLNVTNFPSQSPTIPIVIPKLPKQPEISSSNISMISPIWVAALAASSVAVLSYTFCLWHRFKRLRNKTLKRDQLSMIERQDFSLPPAFSNTYKPCKSLVKENESSRRVTFMEDDQQTRKNPSKKSKKWSKNPDYASWFIVGTAYMSIFWKELVNYPIFMWIWLLKKYKHSTDLDSNKDET